MHEEPALGTKNSGCDGLPSNVGILGNTLNTYSINKTDSPEILKLIVQAVVYAVQQGRAVFSRRREVLCNQEVALNEDFL